MPGERNCKKRTRRAVQCSSDDSGKSSPGPFIPHATETFSRNRSQNRHRMHLETPVWLSLTALVPLAVLLAVLSGRAAARRLRRLAAPGLLPLLGESARWPGILRLTLVLTAVSLAALALSRPSLGYTLKEVKSDGCDLILAIDVSQSMLCRDVTPDRLTRAKLAARDVIESAKGLRTGVVLFAGDAFLECPLTLDAGAVSSAVDAAATSSIPRQGTDLARAVAEARAAFGEGTGRKILVLLTDGEDLEGAGLREARASKGVTIVTVGVGTAMGAPVPEPDGKGYKRGSGGIVTSRPDFSSLEAIADATGGFSASIDSPLLATRIANLAATGEGDKPAGAPSSVRVPIIRYRWPLALALLLLAAESLVPAARRKSAGVAALILLFLPAGPDSAMAAQESPSSPAPAQSVDVRAAYNQGVELFNKGDFAKASEAFDNAAQTPAELTPELRAHILGNAGAAKLASAHTLFPTDAKTPVPQDAAGKITDLCSGARKDLENALSLAPGDALLRANYQRLFDTLAELDRRKAPPPEQKKENNSDSSGDKKEQAANDDPSKGDDKAQSDKSGDRQSGQQAGNEQKGGDKGQGQSQSAQNGHSGADKSSAGEDGGSQSAASPASGSQQGQSGNESNRSSQQNASNDRPSSAGSQTADNKPGNNAASGASQQNPSEQGKPQAGENSTGAAGRNPADSAAAQPSTGADGKSISAGSSQKGTETSAETAAAAASEKPDTQNEGGKDAAVAAGESSDREGRDQRDDSAAAAAEESRDGKAAEDSAHRAENAESRKDSSPGDRPKSEGSHTKGLDRPDDALAGDDAPHETPEPPAAPGAMTPGEARELLRLTGGDDKPLPAGKTGATSDNDFTGRDW